MVPGEFTIRNISPKSFFRSTVNIEIRIVIVIRCEIH